MCRQFMQTLLSRLLTHDGKDIAQLAAFRKVCKVRACDVLDVGRVVEYDDSTHTDE